MFNIEDDTISDIQILIHHIFYKRYPYISYRFYSFNPHNSHLKDIKLHRINFLAYIKKNSSCMINIGYLKFLHKSSKWDDMANNNFLIDYRKMKLSIRNRLDLINIFLRINKIPKHKISITYFHIQRSFHIVLNIFYKSY